MKKLNLLFIAIGLLMSSISFGQKAQEILGIAKENKSKEYYKEQLGLWRKVTDQNPKNAHAWYQIYKAKRAYLQKDDHDKWLNNQAEIYADLKKIIDESKKHIDKSYEYYLMESRNSKGDKMAEYSQLAYDVDPDRTDTYEGLLVHYVLHFQYNKAKPIAKKMLEKNYYSNANLKWNYNALQTAVQNGAIITHGDMDAIPKWVLQYGMDIRKDVLVVSKWILCEDKDYRNEVFRKMQATKFEKGIKDFPQPSDYVDNLVVHLLKNSKIPVYIGCGTPFVFFEKFKLQNHIYLVGTAFRYSETGIDNTAIAIKNFEQKYDLEYLFNNFQNHPDDEIIKRYLNVTYIPGLMKLKKHYELSDDPKKVKYYSSLIDKVAVDSGRKEEIMSWYK